MHPPILKAENTLYIADLEYGTAPWTEVEDIEDPVTYSTAHLIQTVAATAVCPTHPAGAGGGGSTEKGGGGGAQVTVVGQGAQLHAPPVGKTINFSRPETHGN